MKLLPLGFEVFQCIKLLLLLCNYPVWLIIFLLRLPKQKHSLYTFNTLRRVKEAEEAEEAEGRWGNISMWKELYGLYARVHIKRFIYGQDLVSEIVNTCQWIVERIKWRQVMEEFPRECPVLFCLLTMQNYVRILLFWMGKELILVVIVLFGYN